MSLVPSLGTTPATSIIFAVSMGHLTLYGLAIVRLLLKARKFHCLTEVNLCFFYEIYEVSLIIISLIISLLIKAHAAENHQRSINYLVDYSYYEEFSTEVLGVYVS